MSRSPTARTLEWRLYRSRGWLSGTIHWYDHGYTHVDVVDPRTGWLWGAHCDAMVIPVESVPKEYSLELTPKGVRIPSGFYPRPPNYGAKGWEQVTAFRLAVGDVQSKRFWEFTQHQWAVPYDTRGLIEYYITGRDWRDPNAWWCSEEQQAACEHALILRRQTAYQIDPQYFSGLLIQAGATHEDLPIPVPDTVIYTD